MNKRDEFLKSEMAQMLMLEEKVLHTATAFTGPLVMASLFGMVGHALLIKHYYAVLTNRRLVFIRSSMGLFGLKPLSRGVIEFPLDSLSAVHVGGMLNQRKLTLESRDGRRMTIRLNSLVRQVSGQKEFCAEVPELLQRAAEGILPA